MRSQVDYGLARVRPYLTSEPTPYPGLVPWPAEPSPIRFALGDTSQMAAYEPEARRLFPMPERSFGRTVRYRRTKLGMSQTRLAELVGRSPATIRSWEAERSTPTDPKVLETLVAILGIDERTLFGKAGVEREVVVDASPTVEQALSTLGRAPDPDSPSVSKPSSSPRVFEELTDELTLDHGTRGPEGAESPATSRPPRVSPRPALRVVPGPKPVPMAATTTTTLTPVAVREPSYMEDPAQRQLYLVRTLAAVVGLVALVVALFWAFGQGLEALGSWWSELFSKLRL